jgi:hypothetical protein
MEVKKMKSAMLTGVVICSALFAAAVMAPAAIATAPTQTDVPTVLGPKAFRDGDVIEIVDVKATSPKLEQGDSVTVRGRYRLESRQRANLALFLTQLEGDGNEETDAAQMKLIEQGLGGFELKATIKHRGVLHLSFYDVASGQGFGGVYFGTQAQVKQISDQGVGHYLKDDSR